MDTTSVNFSKARACYPPSVESVEILGYVKDFNNIGYSRDIGRSSILGGYPYFVFGDTFNKNNKDQFVGLSTNTAAFVPDRGDPLRTEYMDIQENGKVNEFIPLNESERGLTEKNVRVMLWAFGGIAETVPNVGWTYYQVAEIDPNCQDQGIHKQPDCPNHYWGVGIARVSVNKPGRLQVTRLENLVHESRTNRLSDTRCKDLIFNHLEPRFGSFSCLVHNEHIYLWGDLESKIYLARVNKFSATLIHKYEYWDGSEYVKDMRKAIPVLEDVQHGAIVHSGIFGRDRPWIFVGCTKWADSQVMIGAAGCLEGPWMLTPLFTAGGLDRPAPYMYCMYPHPWAFNEEDGELLITWSEHWPGGVVGARVKLTMVHPSLYWAKVPLDKCSYDAYQIAAAWAADARALVRDSQIKITLVGQWVRPGMGRLPGTPPLQLLITGMNAREVADATYVARVKLEVLDKHRNQRELPEEEHGTGSLSRVAHWVGDQIRRVSSSSKSSKSSK